MATDYPGSGSRCLPDCEPGDQEKNHNVTEREKEIRGGKKGEKDLDLLRAEIKMLEKYFRDVQFSTGKKQ